MNKLMGRWRLNKEKTSSQKSLLVSLLKPAWQVQCVDWTQEELCLLVFTKNGKNRFVKDVRVYVDTAVFGKLRYIMPDRIREISFQSTLIADGLVHSHGPDKKEFGNCETITTCDHSKKTFCTEWDLIEKGRRLVVTHRLLSPEVLKITIECWEKPPGNKLLSTTSKVYDRVTMQIADISLLRSLKH